MNLVAIPSSYVGRFAPSPTGPLHLGSLYTALASFIDARYHNGQWRLRIDDLDTPRNVQGASDAILRCLEQFELYWDGEVYYQSQHVSRYHALLHDLIHAGQIYACRCSRKQLAQQLIYPGNCREAHFPDNEQAALRVKINAQPIDFEDDCQGKISQKLTEEQGDFIVRRRDQIIAYQFAVVVDDHDQGVNHVVRGVDLLDSTAKQIHLHQQLGFKLPNYLHLPILVDAQGQKLSKQTLAAPVDTQNPSLTLWRLLKMLRQNPPENLRKMAINEQLQWAIGHWQPHALKKIRAIHPGFD